MKKIINILMKGVAGLLFVALLAINVQVGLVETNGSDSSTELSESLVLTNQAKAQTENDCYVSIVECGPFPWSEEVQHCVTTGDGLSCTCGDAESCDEPQEN